MLSLKICMDLYKYVINVLEKEMHFPKHGFFKILKEEDMHETIVVC